MTIYNNHKIVNNPIIAFDSGIGSLSIIKELQRQLPDENILFFADRIHFPYGTKTREDLFRIILNSIKYLERFSPKLIILASNTPSIQFLNELKKIISIPLIGVIPPLKEAVNLTKKNYMGIMATTGTIKSKELRTQINSDIPQHILISKFDASPLIENIENGYFLHNKTKIDKIIRKITTTTNNNNEIDKIDVMILSSTHLPLIRSHFIRLFPKIKFIDPAQIVAQKTKNLLIEKNILKKTKNGTLKIMVSKNKKEFQKILFSFGVKQEPVEVFLSF